MAEEQQDETGKEAQPGEPGSPQAANSGAPQSPPESGSLARSEPLGQAPVPTGTPQDNPTVPAAGGTPSVASEPVTDPKDARIIELEGAVARLTSELTAAREGQATVQKSLAEQLAIASNRYKTLALAGNPELPAELVEGGTVDQVEASIEKAKAIVAKVKARLAEQATQAVPGGAPVRAGPDVEALSPIDKIKYSLAHRKK